MQHFRSADDFRLFTLLTREAPDWQVEERAREFLHALLATSTDRTWPLRSESIVWRAQLGADDRSLEERGFAVGYQAHPPARMKPTPEAAAEGRVSPKGRPCFYCANNRETAMSEVRPWLGSQVSLARFRTNRDLRLVAFLPTDPRNAPAKRLAATGEDIWRDVGFAFSAPVSRETSALDYRPTQIIATFFREQGFDGVLYASLLGKGNNIALFDIGSVDIVSCALKEVRSLQYGFSESLNRYQVDKLAGDDV
jgi:hypothetical protein